MEKGTPNSQKREGCGGPYRLFAQLSVGTTQEKEGFYSGWTYRQRKEVNWRDGISALRCPSETEGNAQPSTPNVYVNY
jgi:hypothetical protein